MTKRSSQFEAHIKDKYYTNKQTLLFVAYYKLFRAKRKMPFLVSLQKHLFNCCLNIKR